jgi:hypothetical protein
MAEKRRSGGEIALIRSLVHWRATPERTPDEAYSGLHLNEERKKVGRNKRSVSGRDELRKRYVFSLK